jgi:hypothetical protein
LLAGRRRGRPVEDFEAAAQQRALVAVREQPIVTNALTTVGKNVKEEAADELVGGQGDELLLVAVLALLLLERDVAVADADEALVGNRDAVGMASRLVGTCRYSGDVTRSLMMATSLAVSWFGTLLGQLAASVGWQSESGWVQEW